MNRPLVSIIAVCYNHSRYAITTLESIVNQSYENIELIIMDDCSTDTSVAVIQDWIDKNNYDYKFVAHKQNQGLCKTLNEALEIAQGEFIQIISCDDILMENKIELQANLFNKLPSNYGVLHSNLIYVDELGNKLNRKENKKRAKFSGFYYYLLLESNQIAAPTLLYKRQALFDVGKFDERYSYEDLDILLKISKKFKIEYLDMPLIKYRILQSSLFRSRGLRGTMDRLQILFRNIEDKRSKNIVRKNNIKTSKAYLKKLKVNGDKAKYIKFFLRSLSYIPLNHSYDILNYFKYFWRTLKQKHQNT
ncbi:glycosyltransferase family 2 protein [Mesonia ostreae]|uniref:Glycosyltransferase n=1 Tax=Mesonia ostreae TaxID=861110 RepID=A0ABU2KM12_9FLAO|nr:glycosyltransferase [Mesonia ostreae]MDT0295758.1 glycosyltransferase [Mesonia ostreae]